MALNNMSIIDSNNVSLPPQQISNVETNHLSVWQLTHPCPNCKVKCVDGTECIQCNFCFKWFHFECSGLSKKSFSVYELNPDKFVK